MFISQLLFSMAHQKLNKKNKKVYNIEHSDIPK